MQRLDFGRMIAAAAVERFVGMRRIAGLAAFALAAVGRSVAVAAPAEVVGTGYSWIVVVWEVDR